MKKPQVNDLAMHVWRLLREQGDGRPLSECAVIAERLRSSGLLEGCGADEALRRAVQSGDVSLR